jgi:hypothetical protein
LAVALLALGCKQSPVTEVMVFVRSDLSAAQLRSVLIRVEVAGATQSATPCTPVDPSTLPISIGLVQQGHTSGSFTVRAIGYSDAGCGAFSVEQSATLQFLTNHTLELDLNLLATCAGRMCDPGTTCYDSGACRSDTQSTLPEYHPGTDMGVAADGATEDLAGADLAGADLSSADDLSTPPDLLPSASTCVSYYSPGQLCESFESGTINGGIWYVSPMNATLTVDTTRAYRGTHSLKVATGAVTAPTSVHGHIQESSAVGTANHMFVRAFYYLSSLPFANTYALSSITSVTVSINIDIGGHAAGNFHLNTAGAAPKSQTSTVIMPTDTWFCFEYEIDQPNGIINGWMNDGATPVLNQTGVTMDPLNGASMGIAFYGPSADEPAHTVWVDEIIVDGQRIGCAK